MRRFCILPLMLWAACAQARTLVLSGRFVVPVQLRPGFGPSGLRRGDRARDLCPHRAERRVPGGDVVPAAS